MNGSHWVVHKSHPMFKEERELTLCDFCMKTLWQSRGRGGLKISFFAWRHLWIAPRHFNISHDDISCVGLKKYDCETRKSIGTMFNTAVDASRSWITQILASGRRSTFIQLTDRPQMKTMVNYKIEIKYFKLCKAFS